MPRWDHVPARVGRVILYVFAQARLLANDFWPGLMHAIIFWGFVVLTLGTVEFFGRGVTESFFLPLLSETPHYLVLQDLFSTLVILAVGYALFRRLVTRPKRLNFSTEALVILLLILGLMVTDLVADAAHMRLAPESHNHWQFAGSAIAPALGGLSPARGPGGLPPVLVGARGPAPGLPGAAALLEAPAHPGLAAQRLLLAARAEGPVPQHGSGELGDLRGRQPDRPGLEGSLRHLQLHRVRPLHLALPGQHERQGARPEVADPAPAGAALRGGAGAAGPAERQGAREDAGGRHHPRQRALGLHHLPLVRGRLPGLHRARAEDRRHAALAGAHRVALPGRAAARVPQPRDQRQPVADVVADARRLGAGPGREADGRGPGGRVPLLGRLLRLLRRAQQEGGAGAGEGPAGRGRGLRDPRQRGEVHRRAGPAPGPRVPLPDAGPGQHRDAQAVQVPDDRHRVPALLQYHPQRVPAVRRPLPGDPPHPAPRTSSSRSGGSSPRSATASASPTTTRATSAATTTSTTSRGGCWPA